MNIIVNANNVDVQLKNAKGELIYAYQTDKLVFKANVNEIIKEMDEISKLFLEMMQKTIEKQVD